MPQTSTLKLDPYSPKRSSPIKSIAAGSPVSNQFKTPKKGYMHRNPVAILQDDNSNPLFRDDVQLPYYSKPPLGKSPGQSTAEKYPYHDPYSPNNYLRGLKNDPFLQRLHDYREIYEMFKDNYDTYSKNKSKRPPIDRTIPLRNQVFHSEDRPEDKTPIVISDYYSSPNTVQRKLKQRPIPDLQPAPPLFIRKKKRDIDSPIRNDLSSAGTYFRPETESSEFEPLPSILKERTGGERRAQNSVSPKRLKTLPDDRYEEDLMDQSLDIELEYKRAQEYKKAQKSRRFL